jgi:putative oxidoreductase
MNMTELTWSTQTRTAWVERMSDLTRYLIPVGRALFALIFVVAGLGHFSKAPIDYAAAAGVPLAGLLVPLSGVIAILGGLSIAFGYHARLGAALLILFLVPVTLAMHAFWTVADPMMAKMQMVMFMKNTALLGAALLIAHIGAGPISLDARRAAARG